MGKAVTKMMAFSEKPVWVLVSILLLGMSILLLSSCAPKASPFPSTMPATVAWGTSGAGGEKSWWICRFKISWPPGVEADGTVDLLLAHAVVGPVLHEHSKDLSWWRFHRRAVRDETGHQFSFLFYSTPSVSLQIMDALRESKILQQALDAQLRALALHPNDATVNGLTAMSYFRLRRLDEARERFMRRQEYGVGKMYDQRL